MQRFKFTQTVGSAQVISAVNIHTHHTSPGCYSFTAFLEHPIHHPIHQDPPERIPPPRNSWNSIIASIPCKPALLLLQQLLLVLRAATAYAAASAGCCCCYYHYYYC